MGCIKVCGSYMSVVNAIVELQKLLLYVTSHNFINKLLISKSCS